MSLIKGIDQKARDMAAQGMKQARKALYGLKTGVLKPEGKHSLMEVLSYKGRGRLCLGKILY